MAKNHFQPHKRKFKWARRIILILLMLFLGTTIVGTINGGFQWLLNLLAKIFPFGFGSGDFNDKNFFQDNEAKVVLTINPYPTLTAKAIEITPAPANTFKAPFTNKSTQTITVTATPTITLVPIPTVVTHVNNNEGSKTSSNSYVKVETLVAKLTPNPSPLPKIRPTPNKESSTKYVYIDENLVSALKENTIITENNITFVTLNSSLKTNLSNIMVETNITKSTLKALFEIDVYSIDLPFKTIDINEIYKQLEETRTDYFKLEWFLDENNEYQMKVIFKKNGFDIYELLFGERWSIYY